MAHNIQGFSATFESGVAALVSDRFVKLSSTRENAVVYATTGDKIVGVTVSTAGAVGAAVTVQVNGIAKVEALGSTLAFGDFVRPGSSGRIATAQPATGSFSVGQITAGTSGSTGRKMSVLLKDWGSS